MCIDPNWVIAIGAGVQAGAAIIVAVLTRSLVRVTRRYADSTKDYVETTKEYAATTREYVATTKQALELSREQFEKEWRPELYIISVGMPSRVLTVTVANISRLPLVENGIRLVIGKGEGNTYSSQAAMHSFVPSGEQAPIPIQGHIYKAREDANWQVSDNNQERISVKIAFEYPHASRTLQTEWFSFDATFLGGAPRDIVTS